MKDRTAVIQITREAELSMLGRPRFRITGLRRVTWLDRLGFAISAMFKGHASPPPGIFDIELPDKIACALEVFPSRKLQDLFAAEQSRETFEERDML